MNSSPKSPSFTFDKEINTQSINALYGDDYLYIEEVFQTVLKEYHVLADNIISSYTSKNIPALKAAVHKIKPIFGFVGLIEVQQQCQQFENVCQSVSSFEMIATDYSLLENNLIRSKSLIEQEKNKLAIFNSQQT
ncbi:MAG: Hpt domain-containing protein [Chitinophagales bacterium]